MVAITYVDLFSGCGGLSLGLEWAGFERISAIEYSPDAARTYFNNLIARESQLGFTWEEYCDSIKLQKSYGLIVGDIRARFKDFIGSLKDKKKKIDIVAGGPPCQGFSTAGKRDPNDPRNTLIKFMVKAARELNPKVVLVENVPAINVPFKLPQSEYSPLISVKQDMESMGYMVTVFRLKASSIGVPQSRTRIFILGVKKRVFNKIPPDVSSRWDQEDKILDYFIVKKPQVTTHDALLDIYESGYRYTSEIDYQGNDYSKSLRYSPELIVPAMKTTIMDKSNHVLYNHEIRKHKPRTKARFELCHKLKQLGIGEDILHRAAILSEENLIDELRQRINGNQITIESILPQIIDFKTKKHSQIVLEGDKPANTITTLPDDLIHYCEPRVLSVRELARIQSFPDSFVFMGKPTTGGKNRKIETPQYSQVGNAVPPLLAQSVGAIIRSLLSQ